VAFRTATLRFAEVHFLFLWLMTVACLPFGDAQSRKLPLYMRYPWSACVKLTTHSGRNAARGTRDVISSITNRGRLAFMIFRQRFTARVFLNFLGRLLRLTRKTRKKVFLIVDGHPVHKSRSVTRWLAEHHEQIRFFLLPSYSPELNPDELLNQDVKTNALGGVRPSNVQEMMDNVRSYLRNYAGEAHGGEELLSRTPRPIRRQLKSVINLVLGVLGY